MSSLPIFPAQPRRAANLEPFQTFTPGQWQGKYPPARNWIVPDVFSAGTVVMLSGDGGLGKSLLVQQLMTCAAIGGNWLGHDIPKVRSFGYFCEDPEAELHRRQARINDHYHCDMSDLAEDMTLFCGHSRTNYFCQFEKFTDNIEMTSLWGQVEHACEGAQIIAFDTVRKVYGGNELRDKQVSAFLAKLLRLAIANEAVVILTAHPSNEGMSSGSGIAGNRAWHNDVRSRLYLTEALKGERDADPNKRLLRGMKNNYGPKAKPVEIWWDKGVFIRNDVPKQWWVADEA